MDQIEANGWIRHGIAADQSVDLPPLGGVGLEEFEPGRNRVEEILDGDDGACRRANRTALDDRSAFEADARSDGFLPGARETRDLRYRCDRRQRLAAKAQRGDVIEVLGTGEFAGGVAAKSEFDF